MLFSAFQYFLYLIRCIHLHGIHSPFVFHLHKEIINDSSSYYCFDEIESLRAKLLLSDNKITINDLGAGSKKNRKKTRSVKDISRTSLKSPKHAQFLFRLTKHLDAKNIIELGTSLGLTTAYLAKTNSNSNVVSIEGAESIAKVAKINFEKLNIKNIKQVIGNFDTALEVELDRLKQCDLVYFDGNHTEEATLRYFELCLLYSTENSVFVLDDIYWSKGMKNAWETIKKHPKVSVAVDLYQLGIVYFKTNQAKEDFTLFL